MPQYQVAIVECPTRRLTGRKVRTTVQRAKQDCTALWQSFGPRMGELLAEPSAWPPCYGVSVMTGAGNFDYWAAVEATVPVSALPADMSNLSLRAGPYAKCTVPGLENIDDGYRFLYETWPGSQDEYVCDEHASCFELYPENWQPAQPFEIYMPLKKAA
ncbi:MULTISPECIES: GyrI-like domain-containing protein [Cupriavidus]